MSQDPGVLANKILELILMEKESIGSLIGASMEESANTLESILMSLAAVQARMTATHLTRFMEVEKVDMKEVMEISDEISEVVQDTFKEFLDKEMIQVAKELDELSTKVRPTSH